MRQKCLGAANYQYCGCFKEMKCLDNLKLKQKCLLSSLHSTHVQSVLPLAYALNLTLHSAEADADAQVPTQMLQEFTFSQINREGSKTLQTETRCLGIL